MLLLYNVLGPNYLFILIFSLQQPWCIVFSQHICTWPHAYKLHVNSTISIVYSMRSVWQNTVTLSLKNSRHTNTPHRPHNRCVLMVVIVLCGKSTPMSCRYNAHRPTGTIYDNIMRRQVTTIRCTTTPPRLGSFAQISVNIVRQPRVAPANNLHWRGRWGGIPMPLRVPSMPSTKWYKMIQNTPPSLPPSRCRCRRTFCASLIYYIYAT